MCLYHELSLGPIIFHLIASAAFNHWKAIAVSFTKGERERVLLCELRHILRFHIIPAPALRQEMALISLPYNLWKVTKLGEFYFINKHAISIMIETSYTSDCIFIKLQIFLRCDICSTGEYWTLFPGKNRNTERWRDLHILHFWEWKTKTQ